MNAHTRLKKAVVLSAAGVVAAAAVGASPREAGAQVIAQWRFEPDNFLTDSSGNGHTLSNTGAVPSSEVPGGVAGAGSAEFDGADIMRTLSTLDLSPYQQITLSWWQFVDNGKVSIVFEHSVDTNGNPGGFELTVNEVSTDNVSTGVGRPVLRTASNYNGDDQTHAIGSWEQFTMAIDLTATATPTQIVEVTNGAENPFQGADVVPFRNDFFHIGNRFSNQGLGFVGNIDEFTITAIPEPAGLGLAGLGGAAALLARRRRAARA